ncbi:MAG TPA: YhbY family RNA-binding protein [Polyangiaceae bacterium]|nr:YhbY family RNA-binding protein [Polyangiaceae bacterium]
MSSAVSAPELDGRQRRHLRALGHHRKAIVQVGDQGVSAGVVQALDRALTQHELVKVRAGGDAPAPLPELGAELARETGSALAQIMGRTLLFYRPHPEKPRIVLPRAGVFVGGGHDDEPEADEEERE